MAQGAASTKRPRHSGGLRGSKFCRARDASRGLGERALDPIQDAHHLWGIPAVGKKKLAVLNKYRQFSLSCRDRACERDGKLPPAFPGGTRSSPAGEQNPVARSSPGVNMGSCAVVYPMDHTQAAKRYRDQGAEFRAKADTINDEGAYNAYIRMAEAYERLAAVEEQMAASPTSQQSVPE